MKRISLLSGLMFTFSVALVGTVFADTPGVYVIKYQIPIGEIVATLEIKADGTGSVDNMMGKTEWSGAKFNGNDFEFTMTQNTPMGAMESTYKGTVDGDNISGTITNQMGESEFSGERKSD